MNSNFISIKNLLGELVLSHRKDHLRTSITTKEIIIQKPDHTYHIVFDDILSIVPYKIENKKQTFFHIADELQVRSSFNHQLYKVRIAEMLVINRNGRYLRQHTDLIIPLSHRFLEKINQFTDLTLLTSE